MRETTFRPRPPSARARVARTAARLTIRPLEAVTPEGELGIAISRRILATLMALGGRPAPSVAVTPVDLRTRAHGRIKGEWAHPERRAGEEGHDGVVLYLHGSGYNLCSTRTHRPLVTHLASLTGLPIYSAEYRLAPKHVFPAAADDVARAYDWLLAQGWRPDQVVVMGDSAGGHLTLDLALELRRRGRELPAALVMFSPVADVTFELSKQREQVRPDPMISAEGARKLLAHYVADTDPGHPRLTHEVAPGEVLPPTLIQAGGAEMLAADARHIASMLAGEGTEVELEIWPGQMHVFQAALHGVPESRAALRRAARFARGALAASAAADGVREASA